MPLTASAKILIECAVLPAMASFYEHDIEASAASVLDSQNIRSLLIGSEVIVFEDGLSAELCLAVADSALFAQLATKHWAAGSADPMRLFHYYCSFITKLGWEKHILATTKLDADFRSAILGMLATLPLPIAGLATMQFVLDKVFAMDGNAPGMKLQNSYGAYDKISTFQFSYVRSDPDVGVVIDFAAFTILCDSNTNQTLQFKQVISPASSHSGRAQFSIDRDVLIEIGAILDARVSPYRAAMVANVDLD